MNWKVRQLQVTGHRLRSEAAATAPPVAAAASALQHCTAETNYFCLVRGISQALECAVIRPPRQRRAALCKAAVRLRQPGAVANRTSVPSLPAPLSTKPLSCRPVSTPGVPRCQHAPVSCCCAEWGGGQPPGSSAGGLPAAAAAAGAAGGATCWQQGRHAAAHTAHRTGKASAQGMPAGKLLEKCSSRSIMCVTLDYLQLCQPAVPAANH
jgi:hypothetical protein